MKRRILSIITALALCLSLCPTWAFATEADPSLCKHHPEHTADCGYTAPTKGHDCGHEHTEDCYTADEAGGEVLDCHHSHDSECGYVEAAPGAPCGYVCHICPIEALIVALPEQVTEDNADDVRGQLDEILDLFTALTEDEQDQIDLSRIYALQGALDGANDPDMIEGEVSVTYQKAAWNGGVTYTTQTADSCTPVADSTDAVTWDVGWYVVNSTVTISEPITVTGAVNLILADGCTLDAQKGIVVTTDNSLTIYAQSGGTGTLTVTGTTDSDHNASAGIGGSIASVDSGTITIHGGVINVTGGGQSGYYGAAGIGGGTSKSANGGNSGTIIIYGGTVTANSGEGDLTGAGIGGGSGGGGGGGTSNNITIYGGSVTASSTGTGTGGAGIGGGGGLKGGGAGNNIQIYGGTIKATGSSRGAGIGGGGSGTSSDSSYKSGDGAVTISGGTVTAVGGNYAAGIGGGGGYYYSNQYTSGGCIGGAGSVTISGGIVDAKGGEGNSSGNYAGAPIGNGGNTSGAATVSKTTGIVFENGAGTVCGDVTLDGNFSVPGDYTLNIPAGASLSGSGTLSGGSAFTTENLTADMISVPTNLYYNGEDRTADITTELFGELDKGITICGQTFTVGGWALAVAKTDDLHYTATYTNNNDNTNTFTKTITLQKSGTDLSEGKVQTYKGETPTKDFTAGDTITVKATPTATGKAPDNSAMFAASFTAPTAGQMAVFVGDTQVSEAVGVDEDGSYTMTVPAADVLLAVGGPGTEIPLTARFTANDNMADGAGTVKVNITAAAVAEKDGKVIGYYGESGLDAALADKNNEGAVFTLLKDVTYEEREQGLEIKITCTLDLGGYTIRSKGEYAAALSTYVNTTVTIRGEGTVISEQGHGFSVGGTATPEGGTFISGAAGYNGVYVRTGKLIVTGEAVVIENTGGGIGLGVNSGTGATAQLSAGTYGGGTAVTVYGSTTLAGLLNQEGASRVAYYKDNTTLVTEGLDGQTLPSGSYTVKACTHIFGSSPTCLACGEQAVARVTIGDAVTHYGDLPSAWAAVQGKTADLYLLKSVDAAGVGKYNRLDLASGSVTLGMADGVILTGSNQDAVIFLEGGELTLNSGTIRNSHTYGLAGLRVQSGTLHINGGTVVAYDEGVFVVSGQVEITGGTFTGNNGIGFHRYEGTVKISGGQFSGSREAVYNSNGTLADLLAEGYAFKQNGNWVTDTSGNSLTGTVTVAEAPVKITAQPTGGEVTYGTDASLSVTAAAVGESQTITYQWYRVGENSNTEIAGATAASYTASGLGAGTYQYYCAVTCDSYTVKSETVTVTVKPRQLTPTITGTSSKTYDGTTGVASGQLSITLTGVLAGDTVTATASYAYDNANAGEGKTITASGITLEGGSKDNYTLSSTTATTTGTITKSQPTIAFAGDYNPSKTYDGQTIPNPTADDLTITGAGYANVTFVWYKDSVTEANKLTSQPKDAGSYVLTANILETDNTAAANTSPLTVTISKATLTATGATVASKPYDTNDTAAVTGVTFSGLVSGETLALGTDYTATGKFDSASAGTGKSVTVTVTLADTAKANNYQLSDSTCTATADITKASSSITKAPTASGITYGQALSDSNLTDGAGSVAGAFSWTAPATKPSAGTAQYEVTFTPTDTNYNTAKVNVSVTVAKATPTVTWTNAAQTLDYTGSEAAITPPTVTLVNGESFNGTISYSYAPSGFTGYTSGLPVNAGTYTVKASIGEQSNYIAAESGEMTLTISKVNYTGEKSGTTSGKFGITKTYNLANLLPDGYKLGTITTTDTNGIFDGTPTVIGTVLTYKLVNDSQKVNSTGKITVPVTESTNYNPFNLEITVKVTNVRIPDLNVNPISVVYTGNPVNSNQITGTATVDGDTVLGTWSFAEGQALTDVADSGPKSVVFSPTNTGEYGPATGTVTVTIRKANPSLTLTPSPATLPSGGTVTLTLSGLPSGGSATVTCSDANITVTKGSGNTWTADLPAGGASYTFTASYSGDGNHNGATASCIVSVEKITPTLSLTASPASLRGGGTVTLTLSGLPAGGTAAVTCDRGITVTAGAGSTWTATLPNSTATYTFMASYAGSASYNAASASCTVETSEVTVLPNPPAAEDGKQYQVVMEDGISEVPVGLQSIETLNTPEKLETAMKTAITQANSGVPQDNTAVYDVELQISDNGGATWTKATAANFPANGLTVTLPYPAGTNSGYTFTVVHMFTTSDFNKTPGDTETPRVTNTASGLRFTVTGLSPISVGWEQPKTPVTPPTPSGGGGGGGSSVSTYAVTIEKSEHGKVTSNRTNASSGSTVTLTVTPDSGYVLDTLTVTDSRGSEIRLTAQGSGKYTFTMPSRAVTVKATFAPLPEDTEKPCDGGADCPSHGFTDLGTVGTWYHEAVDYVLRNNLMGGYGNGLFGPNDTLTRAQFAQILFNKEGRPAVTGGGIFTDVAPGAWCAPAITWAAERGIVGGYGNGMFGPNDNITREQLAVMLWRYAGSPAATDKELHFNDADKASGYALDALRWAVENGVINGKGGGILDPKGLATRAQTAQMLKNFLKDE